MVIDTMKGNLMAVVVESIASIWQLTTGSHGIRQIDHVRFNASGREFKETFSADDSKSIENGIHQLYVDVLEFVGYGDKVEYSVSGNKHRTVVLADAESDKVMHIYELHLGHDRVV